MWQLKCHGMFDIENKAYVLDTKFKCSEEFCYIFVYGATLFGHLIALQNHKREEIDMCHKGGF